MRHSSSKSLETCFVSAPRTRSRSTGWIAPNHASASHSTDARRPHAEHFLLAVAERALRRRVPFDHTQVAIETQVGQRHPIDLTAEVLGHPIALELGGLARGEVARDAHGPLVV
jgi:hypothetical protein